MKGYIRDILCNYNTKVTYGYKVQHEAVGELEELERLAEIGKALEIAYAEEYPTDKEKYFRIGNTGTEYRGLKGLVDSKLKHKED